MIRRLSRSLLLPIGLLAGNALPAHAVTPFFEVFSAASLNTARWSLTKDGGQLAPSAGKLTFTAPELDDGASAYIILRGIEPKYNESWEVTVDAVNSTRLETWTFIGVAVLNSADLDDSVGLEISSERDLTEIFSDFETNGEKSGADVEKTISSISVSLRVTFSSATKVISLWYRTSSGAAWKEHATFSTNNSAGSKRRGNWQMNKTSGRFKIGLYGGSEGSAVRSGSMSLDNFQIRNLK
jgi:hypothetical protein